MGGELCVCVLAGWSDYYLCQYPFWKLFLRKSAGMLAVLLLFHDAMNFWKHSWALRLYGIGLGFPWRMGCALRVFHFYDILHWNIVCIYIVVVLRFLVVLLFWRIHVYDSTWWNPQVMTIRFLLSLRRVHWNSVCNLRYLCSRFHFRMTGICGMFFSCFQFFPKLGSIIRIPQMNEPIFRNELSTYLRAYFYCWILFGFAANSYKNSAYYTDGQRVGVRNQSHSGWRHLVMTHVFIIISMRHEWGFREITLNAHSKLKFLIESVRRDKWIMSKFIRQQYMWRQGKFGWRSRPWPHKRDEPIAGQLSLKFKNL